MPGIHRALLTIAVLAAACAAGAQPPAGTGEGASVISWDDVPPDLVWAAGFAERASFIAREWDASGDEVTKEPHLSMPRFVTGEAITVRLTGTNRGDQTVSVRRYPRHWNWTVLDARQLAVPYTRGGETLYGEAARPPRVSSLRRDAVRPGQSITRFIVLDQINDLTVPGTYSLVFSRDSVGPTTEEERHIASPPLHFQVVAGRPQWMAVAMLAHAHATTDRAEASRRVTGAAADLALRTAKAARSDEHRQVRKAARRELLKLRDEINRLAAELDQPAGGPEEGEADEAEETEAERPEEDQPDQTPPPDQPDDGGDGGVMDYSKVFTDVYSPITLYRIRRCDGFTRQWRR